MLLTLPLAKKETKFVYSYETWQNMIENAARLSEPPPTPATPIEALASTESRIRPKCVTISKPANSLQPVPPQPVAQGGVRGALFTLSSEGRPLNFLPAARRL